MTAADVTARLRQVTIAKRVAATLVPVEDPGDTVIALLHVVALTWGGRDPGPVIDFLRDMIDRDRAELATAAGVCPNCELPDCAAREAMALAAREPVGEDGFQALAHATSLKRECDRRAARRGEMSTHDTPTPTVDDVMDALVINDTGPLRMDAAKVRAFLSALTPEALAAGMAKIGGGR